MFRVFRNGRASCRANAIGRAARVHAAAGLFIVAVALIVRLAGLEHSVRYDEAIFAEWTNGTFAETLENARRRFLGSCDRAASRRLGGAASERLAGGNPLGLPDCRRLRHCDVDLSVAAGGRAARRRASRRARRGPVESGDSPITRRRGRRRLGGAVGGVAGRCHPPLLRGRAGGARGVQGRGFLRHAADRALGRVRACPLGIGGAADRLRRVFPRRARSRGLAACVAGLLPRLGLRPQLRRDAAVSDGRACGEARSTKRSDRCRTQTHRRRVACGRRRRTTWRPRSRCLAWPRSHARW